jgi:hypothetical protein
MTSPTATLLKVIAVVVSKKSACLTKAATPSPQHMEAIYMGDTQQEMPYTMLNTSSKIYN